jgi:hypothetical protein
MPQASRPFVSQFKEGVRAGLGPLCPNDTVLTSFYVRITEACKLIDANGDGKFTNKELLAVIKVKLSWLF